ncbi:MAG TPA: universal stress protein [Actinophytocola sp.]|jgi:nucleotide-binding universal stress UspA family protein|uniref:universal stress protein n=1 Tax=Actinophytocola sp. TaxID=1872138 RepID=UPI002F958ED8
MHGGPVIIGFDGTRAALHALDETAPLLLGQQVLVVMVWEAGKAIDLAENPSTGFDHPVQSLDLSGAFAADQAAYEAAVRIAERGAQFATNAGLKAEGLAVADAGTVAETLLNLAVERDARAIVVGTHSHGRVSEVLFGTTTRAVMEHATCPVLVVREKPRNG